MNLTKHEIIVYLIIILSFGAIPLLFGLVSLLISFSYQWEDQGQQWLITRQWFNGHF